MTIRLDGKPVLAVSTVRTEKNSELLFDANGGSNFSKTFRHTIILLWPLTFFTILAVVMTFPLVLDFSHKIVLGLGVDHAQNMWNLWWFKTALFEKHTNPFYTDLLYYPFRGGLNPLPLYLHALQPLNMLLALPLTLLTPPGSPPVLAYNFLALFGLTMSGCAMFWLVRYLTANTIASLIAGSLFAFSPFQQHHLQSGQVDMVSLEWLPLYVLFLYKLLYFHCNSPRWLNFVLTVIFLLAATLTSWYFTIYLLIATLVIVLVRIYEEPARWLETLKLSVSVVGTWLVIISPLLIITLRNSNNNSFELVSGLDYEVMYSLNPLSWVGHIKDGRVLPAVWTMGALSYVSLALGLVGAIGLKFKSSLWAILVVTGAVLSLGPYLKLDSAATVAATTGFPLPYLLVRNLPFISISRVPERYIVLTHFSLAVLAGFGAANLLARLNKTAKRWLQLNVVHQNLLAGFAAMFLLVASLLELATVPQPMHTISSSPFFSRLATEPGNFAILELPFTRHYIDDYERMLYQTVHGKPIFGGYLSRKVHDYYHDDSSPFFQLAETYNWQTPDLIPQLNPIAVLNYYNIKYVVEYQKEANAELKAYLQKLFPITTTPTYKDAQLTAYKVPDMPQTSPLVWLGNTGWYQPETGSGGLWRWSKGVSNLYILNKTSLLLHLKFKAATLVGNAHLVIKVNGVGLKSFDLLPAIQQFNTGSVVLSAGQNEISFVSDNTPISPTKIGLSKDDNRSLAFVIKELSLN